MRIAIETEGSGAPWIAAMRKQARGEEIREFESGAMARMGGGVWLDLALRGVDVFHASSRTPGAPRKVKLTATVDDLSHWLMPEVQAPGAIKAARDFADRILARAHGLIAVSEAVRQDAARVLGVEPAAITTIYPGVDTEFFEAKAEPGMRPYVLAAGGDHPRRNFRVIQEAWRALKPELRSAFELIVDAAPSPARMAGATLLVHVPLYEGFPLPVAQAMAAGIAVVISDSSSLPEIGRDAGLMTPAHDAGLVAAAITRLLESAEERAKFARYGRARAEKYRWERCAAESLAFFHRVLGR